MSDTPVESETRSDGAHDASVVAEELPASLLEVATDNSSVLTIGRHYEEWRGGLGIGISFRDSSTSVRSSIYRFLTENGRTYHAFHSGKYLLPNDESEQDRLEKLPDLQHHSFKIMMDGKLHFAPLTRPKRVLDIGTGTGIWAVEFAQEYREASVIGTDLSPIQPDYVPPNCRFEISDAEEDDWGFDSDHKFDYIRARALVTSCMDGRAMMRRAFDNLEPGGYFELQDPCLPMRCDDGTLDGTALAEWNRLLVDGMLRIGKDLRDNVKWGSYMREVGFVDVVETHAACAFNTWPKGEKNKLLGALSLQNLLEGVDSMGRAVFTRVLGWSADRLDEFLERVKNDLRNKRIHVYCGVYFVHGRKPLV
ncbi:methyltransferase domain-containing protein [Diplogelasinospora grovesii]|uniref:Methyltransferase domain-containing protein n=1 Tax=Diplogelasinospora grovesii TaxID=303347 RepID=A0AAN6MX72_9PEZI|nr:methyltransferase domain-containing protein [Diplogelasinospora grovesii]